MGPVTPAAAKGCTNPTDEGVIVTVTAQPAVSADRESALLASVPTGLLINGEWRDAISGKTFDVEDPATGKVLWNERLPGDYSASLVGAEGRVYFINEAGLCTVVKANPTFEVVAKNDLAERTLASPAVADGALFLRTKEHLYRIGTDKP